MSDPGYIETINGRENVSQTNCFISSSSKVVKKIQKVGFENHGYSVIEIKDIGALIEINIFQKSFAKN